MAKYNSLKPRVFNPPRLAPINISSQCSTCRDPPHVYLAIIYEDIITNNARTHTNNKTITTNCETLKANIYMAGLRHVEC